jgi:Ubiquitin family
MKIKVDQLQIPMQEILDERFCRNHQDFEFSKVFREYSRFIELKLVTEDFDATLLSPSPIVDAMWHLHILDTKKYSDMCSTFPSFIHHDPDGGIDTEARRKRYESTLLAYRARFGETPPHGIWPENLHRNEIVVSQMTHCQDPTWYHTANVAPTHTQFSFGTIYAEDLNGPHTLTFRNINFQTCTVYGLMERIQKVNGIPPEECWLIYAGKQLKRPRMLSEYNFQDGCTFHIMERLRGC